MNEIKVNHNETGDSSRLSLTASDEEGRSLAHAETVLPGSDTAAVIQRVITPEAGNRGSGAGTALLSEIEEWAEKNGAVSVVTSISPDNPSDAQQTKDFFEKRGYDEVSPGFVVKKI